MRSHPVAGSPSSTPCRIGLRGDRAFVACAENALAGRDIDVRHFDARRRASEADALVAAIPIGRRGAREVGRLREQLPNLPIVAVIGSIDEGTARALLRAGVRGIVLSQELEQALEPTVRAALAGQVAIPRSGRHQVFQPVLSHREKTVLAEIALGRTNEQIAASLNLEESTVKSHLRSLFAKLGVRSRKDAAAAVFDSGSQAVSGVLAVTEGPWELKQPDAQKSGQRLVSS